MLIGFKLTDIQLGQAVIELEAIERHGNPMGTLNGGVLCDSTDAAVGMATEACWRKVKRLPAWSRRSIS